MSPHGPAAVCDREDGLGVLIAPGAAAFFFGWRAQWRGVHSGLAPAVIGTAAIIASIVLNVATFAAGS